MCRGPVREVHVQRITGDCLATRAVGSSCEMRIRGTSDAVRSGCGKAKGLVNASELLNVAAYCVTGACRIRRSRPTKLTYGDFLALRSTQTRNMPDGEAAGETNVRNISSHHLKARHTKVRT